MTVSGVNDFELVTNQIIEKAFRILGIVNNRRSLTDEERSQALITLNAMIKSWVPKGVVLWKRSQATLFLQPSQSRYVIDGSTAHITKSYTKVTTTASALSGATSIVVSDVTGLSIGMYIGIVQDNKYIKWTTIANIVGSTITLNSGLTFNAASASNVFCYQTKVNRFETILAANYQSTDGIELPLTILAESSYFDLSTKADSGAVTAIFYDKQLTTGYINTWFVCDDANNIINLDIREQFFDFVNATDTPDFPPEMIRAIIYNLAYDLSFENKVTKETRDDIKIEADNSLREVLAYATTQGTSIIMAPADEDNWSRYQ